MPSTHPELQLPLENLTYSINEMLNYFLQGSFSKLQHTEIPSKTPQMDIAVTSNGPVTNSDLVRFFVVVMDYDPQALCITGHPECELALQSGRYASSTGMD